MIRKIFFRLHLAAPDYSLRRSAVSTPLQQFTGCQGASEDPARESARGARRAVPTTLTLRADPAEPASADFGRNSTLYLHPFIGQVLGEGSKAVRGFFRETEDWHRWLAVVFVVPDAGGGSAKLFISEELKPTGEVDLSIISGAKPRLGSPRFPRRHPVLDPWSAMIPQTQK